eukprot:SM000037S13466  [mRNA]  locus=s37:74563:79103:+ [translate_table: standard]
MWVSPAMAFAQLGRASLALTVADGIAGSRAAAQQAATDAAAKLPSSPPTVAPAVAPAAASPREPAAAQVAAGGGSGVSVGPSPEDKALEPGVGGGGNGGGGGDQGWMGCGSPRASWSTEDFRRAAASVPGGPSLAPSSDDSSGAGSTSESEEAEERREAARPPPPPSPPQLPPMSRSPRKRSPSEPAAVVRPFPGDLDLSPSTPPPAPARRIGASLRGSSLRARPPPPRSPRGMASPKVVAVADLAGAAGSFAGEVSLTFGMASSIASASQQPPPPSPPMSPPPPLRLQGAVSGGLFPTAAAAAAAAVDGDGEAAGLSPRLNMFHATAAAAAAAAATAAAGSAAAASAANTGSGEGEAEAEGVATVATSAAAAGATDELGERAKVLRPDSKSDRGAALPTHRTSPFVAMLLKEEAAAQAPPLQSSGEGNSAKASTAASLPDSKLPEIRVLAPIKAFFAKDDSEDDDDGGGGGGNGNCEQLTKLPSLPERAPASLIAPPPRRKSHDMTEVEVLQERLSKLLLGEDFSGGGRGVCPALTLANAITNFSASVFGEKWKLAPMSDERKRMWAREMDVLLCVADHIVELVPAWQVLPDGTRTEVMEMRQRADLASNLPALRKLDHMLLVRLQPEPPSHPLSCNEALDHFEGTEFWYNDEGADRRRQDKWWLPTPVTPDSGLSKECREDLRKSREAAMQIWKAALAINAQVLNDMEVPESYLEELPKTVKGVMGEHVYRLLTQESFAAQSVLKSFGDLSSEHAALEVANKIEAVIHIWRRKNNKAVTPRSDGTMSPHGSRMGAFRDFIGDPAKRELHAECAESVLRLLKQRVPTMPQTTLDGFKLQYNKDVGQSLLEAYSRVLESLASNVVSRIDDVLFASDEAHKRSTMNTPTGGNSPDHSDASIDQGKYSAKVLDGLVLNIAHLAYEIPADMGSGTPLDSPDTSFGPSSASSNEENDKHKRGRRKDKRRSLTPSRSGPLMRSASEDTSKSPRRATLGTKLKNGLERMMSGPAAGVSWVGSDLFANADKREARRQGSPLASPRRLSADIERPSGAKEVNALPPRGSYDTALASYGTNQRTS